MILGITGGTGCGKTTLLNAVRAAGGMVFDCDEIYHHLLISDAAILAAVDNRFPGVVEDGILNRRKLGTIVFSDETALLDLNRITHAAVKAEVLRLLERKPETAAIDAIALFEGGLAELCDVTVAVTAPTADRIRRLTARDGISADYARSRIAAQHDGDWFRQRCDYVLENDGNLTALQSRCLAFLYKIGIMKENTKGV